MQDKPRRGRPSKKVPDTLPEADSGADPQPETAAPAAPRNLAGAGGMRSRGASSIWMRVLREKDAVLLDLVDDKGRPADPDYRRFEGAQRELYREFSAEARRLESPFAWGLHPGSTHSGPCVEATSRLIDLGLASSLLVDADGHRLEAAGERDRLILQVEDTSGRFLVRPLPLSVAADASPDQDAGAAALSPCHVLYAGRIHGIPDLGPSWRGLDGSPALLKKEDLPLHLSSLLSRFSGVEPRRAGYELTREHTYIVRPALLFREIDAYGYLHVRPFGLVEGFPPGFIEDGELSRVVSMDDETRHVVVADLLFPRFADEEFRRILSMAGKEAKTAVFEEAGRFILDPAFAEKFLAGFMRELMAAFALLEAEKLARYRVLAERPRLRFRTSSGIDFLGGEAEIEIGGERLSYEAFFTEYERDGCVTLSSGLRAFPEARDVARFERLLRRVGATARRAGAPAFRVSAFDLPLLERDATIEDPGQSWDRIRAFYTDYNGLHEAGPAPAIEGGELRPYQAYGARWIAYLAKHGRHGCLADEMGLGKTIQTIAALRAWRTGTLRETASSQRADGPVLIVMPRSLLYNWQAELARFAPEFRVFVHHGADRGESLPEEGQSTDRIILTSYATLRNDLALFQKVRLSWLILDESQSIKNAATQTRAAVASLQAERRLALSGTPVENHLGELWSLFEILEPGFFGESADFTRRWKTPIEGGDQEALKDLRARIYPFMLRRRKSEVLAELPPRTEQTAFVELDPDHLAAYHRRRLELKASIDRSLAKDGFGKSGMLILAAMTELRRLASIPEAEGSWEGVSAKRLFLRETIPELIETGHKALVFTTWLAGVELVSEDLAGLGIGNLAMTGATVERQELVDRFRNDPAIGVFTMTLKTGGLGLNLTAADYVFLLDPWWNRAAEAQAIDRTHRIGQINPVFCYRLIAKDTIEERLLELQERKAGLVAGLLASDAEAMKRLDEADISYLLG